MQPHGAQVILDGEEVGRSPLTLAPEPGSHELQIELEGYAPLRETLVLQPGGEATVAGSLTDIAPPELTLRLSPPEVSVGEQVDVIIEATDNVSVTQISLLVRGELLGSDTDRQGAQLTDVFTWTPAEAGTHRLLARAVDQARNVGELELEVQAVAPPAPTATAPPTPTSRPARPIESPTPTPTPRPEPTGVVNVDVLNVRSGPDVAFQRVGALERGQPVVVLGRDEEATWLRICCVRGEPGWVSRRYVDLDVPVEAIPLATDIPDIPSPGASSSGPYAVSVTETSVVIQTYPYAPFLSAVVDADHGDFPLRILDWNGYISSQPQPQPQEYTLLALENELLRVTLLPELGGRVYECLFKPTWENLFYRNPVIRPTRWGPTVPEGANWWLAVGGLEWGFPVEEHGYEWGIPWEYAVSRGDEGSATVRLWDTRAERLRAQVAVTLSPGEASFGLEFTLENPTQGELTYQFWSNAMLAAGGDNHPSEGAQFLLPGQEMTVHSTGDGRLPGAGEPFPWPMHAGRDVSRLETWREYLGFFVRPAAQEGFAGVYDHVQDVGMVRIFPSDVVRGVKAFGFGWGDTAISPSEWTDDGSSYVELHGGVTPTFVDWAELKAGEVLHWDEQWFPVRGTGGMLYAGQAGAVNAGVEQGQLWVRVFPTVSGDTTLAVALNGQEVAARHVTLKAGATHEELVDLPETVSAVGVLALRVINREDGSVMLEMPEREVPPR